MVERSQKEGRIYTELQRRTENLLQADYTAFFALTVRIDAFKTCALGRGYLHLCQAFCRPFWDLPRYRRTQVIGVRIKRSQIQWRVMQMQPVNMVNSFCWQEVAAKMALKNKAMLVNQFVIAVRNRARMRMSWIGAHQNVAIQINAPTANEAMIQFALSAALRQR